VQVLVCLSYQSLDLGGAQGTSAPPAQSFAVRAPIWLSSHRRAAPQAPQQSPATPAPRRCKRLEGLVSVAGAPPRGRLNIVQGTRLPKLPQAVAGQEKRETERVEAWNRPLPHPSPRHQSPPFGHLDSRGLQQPTSASAKPPPSLIGQLLGAFAGPAPAGFLSLDFACAATSALLLTSRTML